MSLSTAYNFGQLIDFLGNFAHRALAGGAGAATETVGVAVDRLPQTLDGAGRYDSGSVVAGFEATLADTETCTVEVRLKECDTVDGSYTALVDENGDEYVETVVLTGDTGGTTEVGKVEMPFRARGAKQFLQASIEFTFSAGATDIAHGGGGIVFGDAQNIQ